jgi:hypothetical protein
MPGATSRTAGPTRRTGWAWTRCCRELKQLKFLNLKKTKVSDAGAKELQQALPKTAIKR